MYSVTDLFWGASGRSSRPVQRAGISAPRKEVYLSISGLFHKKASRVFEEMSLEMLH